MNFLGLNSPGIFLISVIVLIILGPKRIEKGWLLFQRLLKFLLSKQEEVEETKSVDLKSDDVIEEVIEAKLEEPQAVEVTEDDLESNRMKSKPKPKKIKKVK